jgi:hypothetical protein
MAVTPKINVRVAPELTESARAAAGRPDVELAVLVRAALIVFAGVAAVDAAKAIAQAQTRPGPKPRR